MLLVLNSNGNCVIKSILVHFILMMTGRTFHTSNVHIACRLSLDLTSVSQVYCNLDKPLDAMSIMVNLENHYHVSDSLCR